MYVYVCVLKYKCVSDQGSEIKLLLFIGLQVNITEPAMTMHYILLFYTSVCSLLNRII